MINTEKTIDLPSVFKGNPQLMSCSSRSSTSEISERKDVYAKKLREGLFISAKFNTPHHNLRQNRLEIYVSNGATVRVLGDYVCSCLCAPSSILTTRNNFLSDGTGNLNDTWIDPSTRIVTIQEFVSLKEYTKSEDGSYLAIKLESYGAHPGKTTIKFVVVGFEINYQGQFYQTYITLRCMSKNNNRGFTEKESCFISDWFQKEDDSFLQQIISAKNQQPKLVKSLNRKKTPKKIQKKSTIIVDKQFNSYMEGVSTLLQYLNADMVDEDFKGTNYFNGVRCAKIHFENGPKYGGQANTIYISFKETSDKTLYDYIRENAQYCNIRFVPIHFPGVNIGIPQIIHVSQVGEHVGIHFITTTVLSHFEGDLETNVFVTINDELLEGDITYTFYDTTKTAQSDNIQAINYHNPEDINQTKRVQFDSTDKLIENYTPVVTVFDAGQFFRQQYLQSMEDYNDDLGHFVQNFQNHFGGIVDVFGYNFAGYLNRNGFKVDGIEFKEVVCPGNANENLVTIKPTEVRKEEKIITAEEATDMILKTVKSRIPLTDERMIEGTVQTLVHKMNTDIEPNDAEKYIVNNIVHQKYLENCFGPGKRHARTDKVPYLNLKLVIFDSNALPSHDGQNDTPKLKVALFFAKFVILFDEKSHMIIIEDQETRENFLYQTFYDCNIYTVRKSEEIDSFLTKLAEFNCSWNGSQFYDEKNSNTGHYVITALKYLGIWESSALWAKFATNVCEGKPLEKHVTIYPDFFHMDSKGSIPAMLNGAKAAACPRLKEAQLKYIKEMPDTPFKYSFRGYSDDPEVEAKSARNELEFMCEMLYDCGESYLKNMEDGVRTQRLLKKIMQTNYGQSLSHDTWKHLKQLSEKHNQTFHKQMYNFPNFYNLTKPTQASENLQKAAQYSFQQTRQTMVTN